MRTDGARTQRILALILLGLMAAAVVSAWLDGVRPASLGKHVIWNGFLFGLPMVLGGLLLAGKRWALMGAVMYGTVGLALDISTIVQDAVLPGMHGAIVLSLFTGVLNLLLIVIGGRGLLDVTSTASPQANHPPNPPSRSGR
jgi:hypothetical protein